MKLSSIKSRVLPTIALLMATACAGGLDRPQKEHTFTGNLTAAQTEYANRRAPFVGRALRDKQEAEAKEIRFRTMRVKTAKEHSDTAFAGLGFLPNRTQAYAVHRDGVAVLFSEDGGIRELDKLISRVDRVELAGPRRQRILGLSAHGSAASWNSGNLTQQLLLRPQKSTFGQVKLLDAKPIPGVSQLATASEGGLLEVWSLTSGNRLKIGRLKNTQPREIAEHSSSNRLVFGTNAGEVRSWSGGQYSRVLYKHSGPILKIICLRDRGLIVSAAKDGSVKIFSSQKGRVLHELMFPKAVYEISVSPNGRWLVALPATGLPVSVNLETFKQTKLRNSVFKVSSKSDFTANSSFFVIQHAARGLTLWDFRHQKPFSRPLVPASQSGPLDFKIAEHAPVMAVQTQKNLIEYWDTAEMDYAGMGFTSDTDIEDFALSSDGKWLVVGLTDGRLVRLRIALGERTPIKVN